MARRDPWPKIADSIRRPPPRSQAEERARAAFHGAIAVLVVVAPFVLVGIYAVALTLPAKLAQFAQVWP
jgi:hypothetical protein